MGIILLDSIAAGLLTGGIYGLIAVGLSLIFGVMRFLNFAQGDFTMLGMYLSFFFTMFLGIDALFVLPVAICVFFVVGFILHKLVIKRIVAASLLSQVLLTYGISLVIENGSNLGFGSDYRTVFTPFTGQTVSLLSLVTLSSSYLIAFLISIVIMVLLSTFLGRTKLGLAMRAVSQDVESAMLMGVDVGKVRALTFALGIGLSGGAGVLLSMVYYIFPYVGIPLTINSFIITVLGGMGSIPGAMLGGLILGVTQSVSTSFMSAGLRDVWGLIMFLLILRLKPSGLLGRARA